ncbi:DUF421 domain-containing protein [Pontibacillus yanchengensis]|uniref:YetF C-terminal domain-containing protein n=1 Tax=Pontibacillus yanchengensis Y32 TaxID=1385514 RepID=A0A0A2TH01_9BACI|nr:DUF421 domain-containing protein [Pontibacillus yanchengensis]KGP73341.1 hypothetical protein N782_05540 [Pontibacillus yanchengensis Y32]
MDVLMDVMKVIFRIATILPFMLVIGLFMGKRSIGELPVFDFLVILVLGSVVGADIADPEINHIHTVVAMIGIAVLQKIIIYLKLKHRPVGKLLTFEPIVVIYNGKFVMENMKKINYSIDNVLQMLREKNVFHTEDVEIAIIEANGKMSLKLHPSKESILREDLSIYKPGKNFELPVILDGEIQHDILGWLNKTEEWLIEQLNALGEPNPELLFYVGFTQNQNLIVSKKHQAMDQIPPIEH